MYRDCRLHSSNTSFHTFLFQSQNCNFLVDSLSFMIHLVLPNSPEMIDEGGMGWGWWDRICHLCISSLTSTLRTTKFISCNLSRNLSIIMNSDSSCSALSFKWRPSEVFLLILCFVVTDGFYSFHIDEQE